MMLRRPLPSNRRSAPGAVSTADLPHTLTVENDVQFWIHADAGITLSGSDVTAWEDQSGNDRHCTFIGTPTFGATSWNGAKPAVILDGSSSAIRAGAGAGESIGGVRHEATIVTVFELVSYTLYNMIVGFGQDSSSSFTTTHLMYTDASGTWRSFRGSLTSTGTSTMTVGRYCMIEKLELNGAVLESSMWLNDVAEWTDDSNNSGTNFTFDRYIIGRSPADGGTPYWTEMNLVEAILYDVPLTDGQCSDIYTDLAAYWGGI